MDAERRVQAHNAGRGARYTRSRRPVQLVYVEPQPDRATAMKRERAIKKLTRAGKLVLITQSTSRAGPLLPGREKSGPNL
jgi:putative endonuclease